MQFISRISKIRAHHQGAVLTIGNFDGVHLGHQHLIHRLVQKARALSKPSMIMTFEPLPAEYFSQNNAFTRLISLRDKLNYFKKLQVDYVLCLKFDRDLAELSARNFIDKILMQYLKPSYLLVGEDFHFGKGREGNVALLSEEAQKNGFAFESVQKIVEAEKWISSSRIREALHFGDWNLAHQLLGRDYTIGGRVIHGQKLGRTLGFPTANIDLRGMKLPISGVFAVQIFGLSQKPFFGVANIGYKPTLRGLKKLLEVYLFDFNQLIYGKHITVFPVKKIREEKKFSDLTALSMQIKEDVKIAKEFFRGSK